MRTTAAIVKLLHRAATGSALVLALGLIPARARAHEDPVHEIAALSARLSKGGSAADFLRRAELSRIRGDWRAAEADLRTAFALDPHAQGLDLARVALDLDRGRVTRAHRAIRRVLDARPADPDALLLSARVARARRAPLEVARALDRALSVIERPSPDHVLERARSWIEVGRHDEALRGLESGIALLGPAPALVELAADLGARVDTPALEPGANPDNRPDAPGLVPSATRHGAAPPPVSNVSTVLVPRASVWKYYAAGPLSDAWREPGYADGDWNQGPGVLGFGDAFVTTVIPMGPDSSQRYPTSYFRIRFTVDQADLDAAEHLTLLSNYDDGFVAYVNGIEVARHGLPAGPVGYSTLATTHEGGAYETSNLSAFLGALVPGDNLLAVEVHQSSLVSSDLAWDGELAIDDGPPQVTRGPYLQLGAHDRITVRWRTDVPADSRVLYGTIPGPLASSVTDPTITTEHEVTVQGLAPDTRYRYAIGTANDTLAADSVLQTFTTAPLPGTPKPTRLWVLGDSGLPGAAQNAVRDAYLLAAGERRADLWLMLGDNAYASGTDAEYQVGLFAPYRDILSGTVLWPTRGNHDFVYTGTANDYYDFFTLPHAGQVGGPPSGTEAYYSFDYGDIHFICLDSEGSDRTQGYPMLTWLASDLATMQRTWVIAFWHHPSYTKGSHDSDNIGDSGGRMQDMRENVLPILEQAGVDLVLTGHSHSYERSFLIDEHYGVSTTLVDSMVIDSGDGRWDGSGAYTKPTLGPAPHEGAVHSVVGSGSQISGGTLDHPVMVSSLNLLGSMIVDVSGDRLTARFIDGTGVARDSFVIIKGVSTSAPSAPRPRLWLGRSAPNPASLKARIPFSVLGEGRARLSVHDASGRLVRRILDGRLTAGPHEVIWDLRDERNRRVPSGFYFYRLEAGGRTLTGRIVTVR